MDYPSSPLHTYRTQEWEPSDPENQGDPFQLASSHDNVRLSLPRPLYPNDPRPNDHRRSPIRCPSRGNLLKTRTPTEAQAFRRPIHQLLRLVQVLVLRTGQGKRQEPSRILHPLRECNNHGTAVFAPRTALSDPTGCRYRGRTRLCSSTQVLIRPVRAEGQSHTRLTYLHIVSRVCLFLALSRGKITSL